MSKTRLVIPIVLGLAAAFGAGAAQARDADVRWSVTIGTPVYAERVPVYVRPQPVYAVPVPVYRVHAPVVYPYPHRYPQASHWDRDGDGIPNRHDRVYNPRWDRDGDGIPNRHDRNDRDDRYRGPH